MVWRFFHVTICYISLESQAHRSLCRKISLNLDLSSRQFNYSNLSLDLKNLVTAHMSISPTYLSLFSLPIQRVDKSTKYSQTIIHSVLSLSPILFQSYKDGKSTVLWKSGVEERKMDSPRRWNLGQLHSSQWWRVMEDFAQECRYTLLFFLFSFFFINKNNVVKSSVTQKHCSILLWKQNLDSNLSSLFLTCCKKKKMLSAINVEN